MTIPALPPVIKINYFTLDRYSEFRRFKTLAGARKYARRKLGEYFDIGSSYAVSGDGVAKITANIPLSLLLEEKVIEDTSNPLTGENWPDDIAI
jgi:hypothetical protein